MVVFKITASPSLKYTQGDHSRGYENKTTGTRYVNSYYECVVYLSVSILLYTNMDGAVGRRCFFLPKLVTVAVFKIIPCVKYEYFAGIRCG